MASLYTVLTSDLESLGRVNPSMLTDQQRMELLVSDIKDIGALQDAEGEFLPIHDWHGVHFEPHIDEIDFGENTTPFGFIVGDRYVIGPEGSIDLQWMPSAVEYFIITGLRLDGTVDTSAFPESLVQIELTGNNFRGPFAIESLPRNMHSVYASENLLDGSLNLPGLPDTMVEFVVADNNFSGSIDLSSLPEGMLTIDLANLKLTGSIDLQRLPAQLNLLKLDGNGFQQSTLVFDPAKHPDLQCFLDKESFGAIVGSDGSDTTNSVIFRQR